MSARSRLRLRPTETQDGRDTIREAIRLSYQYPELSDGELIRLAYWGASGGAEQVPAQ